MFGNNGGNHHYEGPGGAADLGFRTAQGRDQEAGDNGGIDSGLGCDPGGDAEGHSQRQGDKSNGDAAGQVGGQVGAFVVFETFYGFGQPLGKKRWFQAGSRFMVRCMYPENSSTAPYHSHRGQASTLGREKVGCFGIKVSQEGVLRSSVSRISAFTSETGPS